MILYLHDYFHLFSGLYRNASNNQIVSHTELKGILDEFKHSMLGSVKASLLDAMRSQAKQKENIPPPDYQPQPSTSGVYNPMIDSDSEEELRQEDSSGSEVEAW